MNTTLEQDIKQVVDKLNDYISANDKYEFELGYIRNKSKDEFTVIYLVDLDNGNKYRVFHSDLLDIASADCVIIDLIESVKDELQYYLRNLEEVIIEVLER